MAPLPIRGLGSVGVITDLDPRELPLNAFTFASNVRFDDGKVSRGPIVRVPQGLSKSPRFLFSFYDTNFVLQGVYGASDGSATIWEPGSSSISETDASPSGYTPVALEAPFTSTEVNNVVYLNRQDRSPWFYNKASSTEFEELPEGGTDWPTNMRCKALRAVNGQLVAINLSQGSDESPQSVLWSDYTTFGNTPPNWAYSDPASRAGLNTLSELSEPLIDGAPLRGRMYLMSANSTWLMDPTGDDQVYGFYPIFNDRGVINANCVVEANGLHYVFGSDDIWAHDGTSPRSLVAKKVKKFVFKSLIKSKANQCFTFYNKQANSIWFCYQSVDTYCRWLPVTGDEIGCNRAMVFNTEDETITFYDLPFVTAAAFAKAAFSPTWEDVSTSWNNTEGSWAGESDDAVASLFIALTEQDLTGASDSLAVYASPDDSSGFGEVDTDLTSPAKLYRLGMDLDEIEGMLRGLKYVNHLYPEITMAGDTPLVFTIGSSMHPSEGVFWGTPQEFDLENYRLDHDSAGRYLHIMMESDTTENFEYVGLDMDVLKLGDV